jgi:CheY-like chemotaxis protein
MALAAKPPLVMVIDDEPAVTGLFTEILRAEGYATLTAGSAEQGLQLLDLGTIPSAVLLDLRMPGAGGLGFLLSLRAHPERRQIPVAVVTADTHLDDTTERAVHAMGAQLRFKPQSVQEIVSLVEQLIESGPRIPGT